MSQVVWRLVSELMASGDSDISVYMEVAALPTVCTPGLKYSLTPQN